MATLRRRARFDYSSDGAYFITLCTYRRTFVLTGESRDIAARELQALPARFAGTRIDTATILPDHVHAIVTLSGSSSTLSAIVQAYKSLTTRLIKSIATVEHVWQRGFYDHVVRNEIELTALREYAQSNRLMPDIRALRTPCKIGSGRF